MGSAGFTANKFTPRKSVSPLKMNCPSPTLKLSAVVVVLLNAGARIGTVSRSSTLTVGGICSTGKGVGVKNVSCVTVTVGASGSITGVDCTGVNSTSGVGKIPLFGSAVTNSGSASSVAGMTVLVSVGIATGVKVAGCGVSLAAERVANNSAFAVATTSGVIVAVLVRVGLGTGVLLGSGVSVLVGVAVGASVAVGGIAVAVFVCDGRGVSDAVAVLVGSGVSVSASIASGVNVGGSVSVGVGVGVKVAVGVGVGVLLGVLVGVCVPVGV